MRALSTIALWTGLFLALPGQAAARAPQQEGEALRIPIEVGPGPRPQIYVTAKLRTADGVAHSLRMLVRRDDDRTLISSDALDAAGVDTGSWTPTPVGLLGSLSTVKGTIPSLELGAVERGPMEVGILPENTQLRVDVGEIDGVLGGDFLSSQHYCTISIASGELSLHPIDPDAEVWKVVFFWDEEQAGMQDDPVGFWAQKDLLLAARIAGKKNDTEVQVLPMDEDLAPYALMVLGDPKMSPFVSSPKGPWRQPFQWRFQAFVPPFTSVEFVEVRRTFGLDEMAVALDPLGPTAFTEDGIGRSWTVTLPAAPAVVPRLGGGFATVRFGSEAGGRLEREVLLQSSLRPEVLSMMRVRRLTLKFRDPAMTTQVTQMLMKRAGHTGADSGEAFVRQIGEPVLLLPLKMLPEISGDARKVFHTFHASRPVAAHYFALTTAESADGVREGGSTLEWDECSTGNRSDMERYLEQANINYTESEIADLQAKPEKYQVIEAGKLEGDPRNMIVIGPSSARLILWSGDKKIGALQVTDELGNAWIQRARSTASAGGR